MSQQGIIKIENGSYLKQLMTNFDKNPINILNKKSFLILTQSHGMAHHLSPQDTQFECNGMMHQSVNIVKTRKQNLSYVLWRTASVEENPAWQSVMV